MVSNEKYIKMVYITLFLNKAHFNSFISNHNIQSLDPRSMDYLLIKVTQKKSIMYLQMTFKFKPLK